MVDKKIFMLNTGGVIEEIYTIGGEFSVAYIKIKDLADPIKVPVSELSVVAGELQQVVHSIVMSAQESYADYMQDVSKVLDSLLDIKKEEVE